MAFAFEKLLVYQKSVDFADQICIATENFARGYGFLCDQLNRATDWPRAGQLASPWPVGRDVHSKLFFSSTLNFLPSTFSPLHFFAVQAKKWRRLICGKADFSNLHPPCETKLPNVWKLAYSIIAINQLDENCEIIPDNVKKLFTTERLKEMRNNIEELIRDAPEEIAIRKQNATLVQHLKEKHFPLNVWTSSIHRLHD